METDDTLVLCYHAVSESWPSELAVTPENLERQVGSLLDAGYRGVTFSAALGGSPGEKLLAVTFDDAYDSVYELALPVLDGLGVPATLYVPTDFPDSDVPFPLPGGAWIGSEHEGELICMSWDRVRQLQAAGWEIGSHTCSHPWLTQISDAQLDAELRDSMAICTERLGQAPTSIAYPYGDHDDRVVEATLRAGYRFACTVPHRFEPFESTPLRFARIDVTRTESPRAFQVRTSAVLRRARATRASELAGWLDRNRLHRATVTGAARRWSTRARNARRTVELCANWRQVLAGLAQRRPCRRVQLRDGLDLRLPLGEDAATAFERLFLDDLYARHLELGDGDVVVDLGAGHSLFWALACVRGADRVLCVDSSAEVVATITENVVRNGLGGVAVEHLSAITQLDSTLGEHGIERIDYLRIGDPALLAEGGADPALVRADRVAVTVDSGSARGHHELVGQLRDAGFDASLDLEGGVGGWPRLGQARPGARRLAPSD